jgi:catechol 2,3-dioxygenase-like lactoylglutathione lyase family enzyme
MPASLRLEVAGLRVTNLSRSLRFYTKALGLRVVARGDCRWWGGGLWVRLEDARTHRNIELNWYPARSPFASRYAVGEGIDHLDFTVGVIPRSDFESIYRRLLRAGARPTRYSPATTEGWMASVRDPDGIWITIGRRATAAERRAMTKSAAVKKRKSRPRKRGRKSPPSGSVP